VNADCTLEGAKVRLRPVRQDDLGRFQGWLNDPDVYRWLLDIETPLTMAQERQWWRQMRLNPNEIVWAIETREGQLLGDIALRLNLRHRWGDLGLFIGEKGLWDQGYGTDAVCTLLRHALGRMGLHRVSLTVDEENVRAIRCYEKCGFIREGLMRQHRLVDGEPRNTVIMAVLKGEFPPRRARR
jgi:RimJ/RimL family protein N-acetyltransferase